MTKGEPLGRRILRRDMIEDERGERAAVINESVDLIYNLTVLWSELGISEFSRRSPKPCSDGGGTVFASTGDIVLESAVSFDVVDAFETLLDSVFRCARTRPNILSQALCFACVHNRLEVVNFLLAQRGRHQRHRQREPR